ncbi:MAG: hypothetical protein JNM88_15295 [Chitinophagaceae bacterium]|nr:hypothetical protein [Chitinophagaceae bacterium]
MTGIFKQKNPANLFLLLVLGVLIKLPIFQHPHAVTTDTEDGILYQGIVEFLAPTARRNPVIYPIITYLLLFIQAVMLTRFISGQRMMNRPNYLPGMAYMLITSLLPEWNYFSPPLLVNTILLFVLSGLFKVYNQPNARGAIFNIGLALGLAAFIFFPAITFTFWILLSLAVMRPFRLNEWVLCLVGVLTPFYFYAVWLFIDNNWSWQNLFPDFSFSLPSVKQSAWLAGSIFLLAVPFLAGGYFVQESLRKMLIQVRKGWSLLLLYLLGAILIPFVNNSSGFENWVMAAIPFAAFHACTYMYSTYKILPLLLFWLTVAFILGYQYAGPGWL